MKFSMLLLGLCFNFNQASKEDFVSDSSEDYSWPKVCDNYEMGDAVSSTDDDDQEEGRRCSIQFDSDYFPEPDDDLEFTRYCEFKYPDSLIDFSYEEDSHTLTCHYRSEYSCEPHQMHVRGNCFDISKEEVPYEEAIKYCESHNGTMAKADEEIMFFFTKMYELKNVFALWVDGYGKQANTPMVYITQKDMFRPERFPESIVRIPHSRPENHSVICHVKPTKIPTTPIRNKYAKINYIQLCDLFTGFNIKATTIENTCITWTQSVVGARKIPNAEKPDAFVNVDHFHNKCEFLPSGYALSPSDHKGYMAMIEMQKLREHNTSFLIPAVLVEQWASATATPKSSFASIAKSKEQLKWEDSSYWDTNQPTTKDRLTVDFPKSSLAFNKNQKLENVMAVLRSPIVCRHGTSSSVEQRKHYHCPNGWTKRDREQGPPICYIYKKNNAIISYYEGKEICKTVDESESYMATMQNEGEEQAITDAILKVEGKITQPLSIWLGATDRNYNKTADPRPKARYVWDIDNTPVESFLRWSPKEPNQAITRKSQNSKEYENCLSIIYEPGAKPHWNDLHCAKEYHRESIYSVRAVACAKEASYTFVAGT